jgi:lipopolysaccharide/colanic/teichoic acid biosynthesis glycosyltransferase
LPAEELLALKTNGVSVQEATDLYENITGRIALNALHPGNLLFTPGFQVSRSGLIGKRMFCAVFSLVGLVLSLPLQLLIAIAIWLDSGGPVIFNQSRVGKDGRLFTLHKFRTMYNGADADGKNNPAEDDDRRCTRVGKWLRRTRLDELPQLYNILVGDMDFIGPRPFVPDQEEELTRQIPYYRCRWLVKPGATGWAQINRGYCATLEDNLEKLSYDLYYVKNLSIGLDLVILFQTIKILMLGRGAR